MYSFEENEYSAIEKQACFCDSATENQFENTKIHIVIFVSFAILDFNYGIDVSHDSFPRCRDVNKKFVCLCADKYEFLPLSGINIE